MTKRITADHIKLKRAYEPASADDGTRILINGSRISRRAHPCENGSVTTRSVGWSFVAGTPRRSTSIPNSLLRYERWQDRARSLSCSRLATNSITTQLRCAMFFWGDNVKRKAEAPHR